MAKLDTLSIQVAKLNLLLVVEMTKMHWLNRLQKWKKTREREHFEEKRTSYRPMPTKAKRSCLVVLKYYKKKSGKVALAREKFSNFCDKTKLPTQ